jgi:hypothetical protein
VPAGGRGAGVGDAGPGPHPAPGTGDAVLGGTPSAPGPVEQGDPVPPGVLGPDPVLDSNPQERFEGTLDACDEL